MAFRDNPDNANPTTEIVLNEFKGLNEVSPKSLMGEPSVLQNVWFDRYGGYRPANHAANLIPVDRNRTNPHPVFTPLTNDFEIPDVAMVGEVGFVFNSAAVTTIYYLKTGSTFAYGNNTSGFRKISPNYAVGYALPTDVTIYSSSEASPVSNQITISPTLFGVGGTAIQVLFSPLEGKITSFSSGGESGVAQGLIPLNGDAGGFILYPKESKVGWSPHLDFEHYVAVYLVPKVNGTSLNPDLEPEQLYPIILRWDTTRTLFQTLNPVYTPPVSASNIPPLASPYNSSASVNEQTIKIVHDNQYKVIAFGLAYPFSRRQYDAIYLDIGGSESNGFVGRVETELVTGILKRQRFYRGRDASNFAIHCQFPITPTTVVVAGDYVYPQGQYSPWGEKQGERKQSFKIIKGGVAPTLTTEQIIEMYRKEREAEYGAIITDGVLEYQIIADMPTHHDISNATVGGLVVSPDSSQMTFERYIKMAAFPPVSWLRPARVGEDPVEWYGSDVKTAGQWAELDTEEKSLFPSDAFRRETTVYRNLPAIQEAPELNLLSVFPIAGIAEWFQNRSWVAAKLLIRAGLQNESRLAVAASPKMTLEVYSEAATKLNTIYYSNLYKPWKFAEEFLLPMFQRSTSVTSMRTNGNILLVHGEADACAIYGNSPANFQIQHLNIPGTLAQKMTIVIDGNYFFLSDGHLYLLEGSVPKSLSEGRVVIPRLRGFESLSYDEMEKILYVGLGERCLMFHLFNQEWSELKIPQNPTGAYRPHVPIKLGKIAACFNSDFMILKQFDAPPIEPTVIEWRSMDGGNFMMRKRFDALYLQFEQDVPTNDVTVAASFFVDEYGDSGAPIITLTKVSNHYHRRLRNKFGKEATVVVTINPSESQFVFRPKMRIAMEIVSESNHQFSVQGGGGGGRRP